MDKLLLLERLSKVAMPVHLIRIESNLDRSYALLGWIEPVPHEIPYEGVAPIEVITCTGT